MQADNGGQMVGGEGGIRTHGTVTRTTILRPLRLRWQLAVGSILSGCKPPEGRSYWNETTRAKQEKLGMSCAALRYQRLLADR